MLIEKNTFSISMQNISVDLTGTSTNINVGDFARARQFLSLFVDVGIERFCDEAKCRDALHCSLVRSGKRVARQRHQEILQSKRNKMKFLKYTSGECSYIRHGAQGLHAALEVVALCVYESGDACAKQFYGKFVEFRKLIEQLRIEGFVHRLGVLRVALVGLKTKREYFECRTPVITAC